MAAGRKLMALETRAMGLRDPKQLNAPEYEEALSRLVARRGVRGAAVTSKNGRMTLYNYGISRPILDAFIEVCADIEYYCTVIARETDIGSRWAYIRVEATDYEMVVSIENTHMVFMYCDRPEAYNGELINDGEDDLDDG